MIAARWETPHERYNAEWPILRRGDCIALRNDDGWAIWDKRGDPIGLGAINSEAWLSAKGGTE